MNYCRIHPCIPGGLWKGEVHFVPGFVVTLEFGPVQAAAGYLFECIEDAYVLCSHVLRGLDG
jgi:hypothetical protein